jgi:hypothetical protein
MEFLLDKIKATKSNQDFFDSLRRRWRATAREKRVLSGNVRQVSPLERAGLPCPDASGILTSFPGP